MSIHNCIINNYLVIKDELLSEFEENKRVGNSARSNNIVDITIKREKEQFEVLRQSLKGNWY